MMEIVTIKFEASDATTGYDLLEAAMEVAEQYNGEYGEHSWSNTKMKGHYQCSVRFTFEEPRDAVLFKLAYSGPSGR